MKDKLEESFEKQPDPMMDLLLGLRATMDQQSAKLERMENELRTVKNRQSMSDYKGTRQEVAEPTERRQTLSAQIIQQHANKSQNVVYTAQSFIMRTKIDAKISWSNFLDLCIEFNRFQAKEGNQNVITYFFQDDYLKNEIGRAHV